MDNNISMVLPGWKKFQTQILELWLPDSFFGGDPRTEWESMQFRAKELGSEFESGLLGVKNIVREYMFWAMEPKSDVTSFMVSVGILYQLLPKLARSWPLEQKLKNEIKNLRNDQHLLEQAIITLGSYKAARLLVEYGKKSFFGKVSSIEGWGLQFIIKDATGFWSITYSADPSEREEKLPIFERSAKTFKFKT